MTKEYTSHGITSAGRDGLPGSVARLLAAADKSDTLGWIYTGAFAAAALAGVFRIQWILFLHSAWTPESASFLSRFESDLLRICAVLLAASLILCVAGLLRGSRAAPALWTSYGVQSDPLLYGELAARYTQARDEGFIELMPLESSRTPAERARQWEKWAARQIGHEFESLAGHSPLPAKMNRYRAPEIASIFSLPVYVALLAAVLAISYPVPFGLYQAPILIGVIVVICISSLSFMLTDSIARAIVFQRRRCALLRDYFERSLESAKGARYADQFGKRGSA